MKWLTLVAVSVLTGCLGPSSSSVHLAAAVEPARTSSLQTTVELADQTQQVPGVELSEGGAPAHAPSPVSCTLKASEHVGLYRTDALPKGNTVLTFDDGPHPDFTPPVLDALRARKMTATFFVVGRAISRTTYPLVQQMVQEGHTLGSHTYSHDVTLTKVHSPASSEQNIVMQHESTRILIDLALLAQSATDFDAMYEQVWQRSAKTWMTGREISERTPFALLRHDELLRERGRGERPYQVTLSRPPGGGPYVEHNGAQGIAIHDRALAKLGMINVMWNGASGDTQPKLRSDFGYLTKNMAKVSEQGGVLLIHDYMRVDALHHALDALAAAPKLRVVSIEQALEHKYGCGEQALGAFLRGGGKAAPAQESAKLALGAPSSR